MTHRPTIEKKKYSIIADAIGFSHFVIVNLIALVGQFTDLFRNPSEFYDYPGLEFVFKYVDAPVYHLVSWWRFQLDDQVVTLILFSEFVFIVSSVLYALIAYIFSRFIFTIFG